MYEAPIHLQVYERMHMEMGDNIYKCVQSYDIDVDKEELIKALKYDREQYDRGYEDGQHSVKGTSYWIYHPDSLEPYYECTNCHHTFSSTVEVVYLTTQEKKPLPTHVPINSSRHASVALCEQITTVSKSRITDRMGTVTPAEWRALVEAMCESLGLGPHTPFDAYTPDLGDNYAKADTDNTKLMAVETELNVYKKLYSELLERMMK